MIKHKEHAFSIREPFSYSNIIFFLLLNEFPQNASKMALFSDLNPERSRVNGPAQKTKIVFKQRERERIEKTNGVEDSFRIRITLLISNLV